MKNIIALSVLVLFSFNAHANSSSVKCSNGFAKIDDLKFEVVSQCGEPIMIETVSGADSLKIERATYEINGWIFDFIYRAGKLIEINRLKRA